MTQIAIHITSYQYTSHHTCPLLLPVSNVSKRKSHHHKVLLCAYWRRSRAWPSQMNHTVSSCQWSVKYKCVCAFARERLLMIPFAWPSWVRPHVCVCVWRACVRSSSYDTACVANLRALSLVCASGVRACVRCRIRGCLACALTYVRKRLACIGWRRHTCGSRVVYLSCELFPTFRLFRAGTLI